MRFYIRFHWKYIKIWKMTPGGTKNENIERQGHQKWVERHQKWARGHQQWAKREAKGSNMEPKWSQNASKNRFSEKVDFMIENVCPQVESLGPILGPKIRKIDKKSMLKSMSKKDRKMIPKWSKNDTKMALKMIPKSSFSRHGDFMKSMVFP